MDVFKVLSVKVFFIRKIGFKLYVVFYKILIILEDDSPRQYKRDRCHAPREIVLTFSKEDLLFSMILKLSVIVHSSRLDILISKSVCQ